MFPITLKHIHYTAEQYDQFVLAQGIAEALHGRCQGILYHEIEWPEDAIPVKAWANRLFEIQLDVTMGDKHSIERANKLRPLLDKLSLQYILSHQDGWKKL